MHRERERERETQKTSPRSSALQDQRNGLAYLRMGTVRDVHPSGAREHPTLSRLPRPLKSANRAKKDLPVALFLVQTIEDPNKETYLACNQKSNTEISRGNVRLEGVKHARIHPLGHWTRTRATYRKVGVHKLDSECNHYFHAYADTLLL